MDLDSTNEDFADNLEKYLQTSIFRSLIAEKYKGQIQSLYDSFYESGKDGLTKLTKISPLKIDLFVPERYASQIRPGTPLSLQIMSALR